MLNLLSIYTYINYTPHDVEWVRKKIQYGELSRGQHYVGGHIKHLKGHRKVILKQCSTNSVELEDRAANRKS